LVRGDLGSNIVHRCAQTERSRQPRRRACSAGSRGQQDRADHHAAAQALRDCQLADQQLAAVDALETQMNAKKEAIKAKIDRVNSAAMKQAMAIFTQTGQYPDITIPTANTVGAQALQAALSRRGDPYVWGAAGPGEFDCSGLVVWAFAQEGITLPHYTGDLWNSGVHIPLNELEPGDLIFFYADISHVGIYLGDGLMVDAPDFGETVQVQAVYWQYVVGTVRIL
jgi:cell wall-associated NlpC family hydrolase